MPRLDETSKMTFDCIKALHFDELSIAALSECTVLFICGALWPKIQTYIRPAAAVDVTHKISIDLSAAFTPN